MVVVLDGKSTMSHVLFASSVIVSRFIASNHLVSLLALVKELGLVFVIRDMTYAWCDGEILAYER